MSKEAQRSTQEKSHLIIESFQKILNDTPSGQSLFDSFQDFPKKYINPLIKDVRSYSAFKNTINSYGKYFYDEIKSSRHGNEETASNYAYGLITTAENNFLDDNIYPKLPKIEAISRASSESSREDVDLSSYPKIADRSLEVLKKTHFWQKKEKERIHEEVVTGMDDIIDSCVLSMDSVRSSKDYHERMKSFALQLKKSTDIYTTETVGVIYNPAFTYVEKKWNQYFFNMVKEKYFSSLFRKAFPEDNPPVPYKHKK